jgi:uncharacterized protein YcbK (DUF882 family)
MSKLSENFSVEEFFKPETLADLRQNKQDPQWHIDERIVVRLEQIRRHFGKPVHITRCYSTAAENFTVEGKPYSQHLYGRGVDFIVEGVDAPTVQAYIKSAFADGGLGHGKNFTHLDCRWSNYLIEWEYPS